jgi:DUF4097 and DUF4098 domain-containing protein YvlB
MFKQTFETSATPHITITECMDNLVVRGSEEQQVTVHLRGSTQDLDLDQVGETFTLVARADCLVTCPTATTLTVGSVHGNLKVEGVEGPVTADTAYGNVKLRSVGPTAVGQTYGNLTAYQVEGDLRAQTTVGNVKVYQAEGSISTDRVDGNLIIEGLQGGLEAERVRGNVRLGSLFLPEQTYRLTTDGNLTVYLPVEASLRLAIRASGGVRSSVPDLVLEKGDGEMRGVLGDGGANLEAQVGGHASLRPPGMEEGTPVEGMPFDFVADLEGLGTQIEARIGEAMAEMESRLAESLGRIDSEEIRLHAEQATQRALRAAGRAAEQARRAADREAERARMRAERAERRWQRASGRRSTPKRESVTDEERMRVLRMVEESKITPEQAAELLAALEGR